MVTQPTAGDLALWALLSGLGAVGLTVILRNAPGIDKLVQEAKKPWACNVCMPLYTAAAVLAVPVIQSGNWSYAVAFPAGYALGYLVLQNMSKPPGPPQIPEEFFNDERSP